MSPQQETLSCWSNRSSGQLLGAVEPQHTQAMSPFKRNRSVEGLADNVEAFFFTEPEDLAAHPFSVEFLPFSSAELTS